MILEDFIRFLDDKGINYRQKDDKLILAECPECGSFKYKVALFTDRIEEEGKLIGKCIKCDAPYTSFSYLLKLGFDIQEVKTLHKYAAVPMVNDDGYATLDLELNREIVKELYVPQVISLASFFKMSEWLDHPASQYSIKRGIPTELYDQIMIDPVLGAVVFVCYEDGKPVGFQRRLLHPFDPAQKTLSSEGWQKTQHILRFPNKGNLLVCEGPFTAVSGYRFGYDSICTFGAGVSNRQLELILDLAVDTGKSIGVAYDLDMAGVNGYKKIVNYMDRRCIPVYRVCPEYGNDLNDSWMSGKGIVIAEEDKQLDSTIPILDLKI